MRCSGTVSPAEFFGRAGQFGAIETGLAADLILLDDNPLENIEAARRIHGVMLHGEWVTRQDLHKLPAAFARQVSTFLVAGNRSRANGI